MTECSDSLLDTLAAAAHFFRLVSINFRSLELGLQFLLLLFRVSRQAEAVFLRCPVCRPGAVRCVCRSCPLHNQFALSSDLAEQLTGFVWVCFHVGSSTGFNSHIIVYFSILILPLETQVEYR